MLAPRTVGRHSQPTGMASTAGSSGLLLACNVQDGLVGGGPAHSRAFLHRASQALRPLTVKKPGLRSMTLSLSGSYSRTRRMGGASAGGRGMWGSAGQAG